MTQLKDKLSEKIQAHRTRTAKLTKEYADVVIDNFKVGTMERWGFDDAWYEIKTPRIVRCAITGYGSDGPKAALPGYDFILQAESGLMSICGDTDGGPTKYGVAIVDICTGMLACNAVLAGLNARYRTNKGQKVEVSLYETSIAMLANVASSYLVSGKDAGRDDPRFASNSARIENRRVLDELIAEIVADHSAEFWLGALKAAGIPCGRINTVAQALQDPHTQARAMVETVAHPTAGPVKMLGIPLKFSDTPASIRAASPTLGQHSEEILQNILGFDAARIASLRANRTI